MKKYCVILVCLLTTINTFAVKLPTGENVRASDVVLDEGKIVSARLLNEADVTTPIGKVKLAEDSEITFYKSGSIKSCVLSGVERGYRWQEAGPITVNGQKLIIRPEISFYESGALARICVSDKTPFEFLIERTKASFIGTLEFYNSDDTSESKLYSGKLEQPIEIEHDGEKFLITNFDNEGNDSYAILLYDNGNLGRGKLERETMIKTSLGDIFAAKGTISFWENKKIKSFINSDALVENISGMLANIPANTEMSVYKSGNLRTFFIANGIEFTVGKYTYITTGYYENGYPFLISETGEILATSSVKFKNSELTKSIFDYYDETSFVIESFDNNGLPCVIINRSNVCQQVIHKNLKGSFDVYVFNQDMYGDGENMKEFLKKYDYYADIKYFLQDGHSSSWVWMVYFDKDDNPTSYSIRYSNGRGKEKIHFIKKKD